MNGIRVGNYIIDKKIAKGSFASVYLARHALTGTKVCMKVIMKENTPIQYVESEVSFMRNFEHPFIVTLYQYFQDETRFFIVMEYIEGPTLLDFINESAESPPAWKVKHLIGEMLQAIYYLHDVIKIAHRDIKLENIILDQNGNLRFIDFGLSKEAVDDTAMKTACGSAMYVAPEILQCQQYTNSTDMWSLGCCIYSLAFGRAPFYDVNVEKMNKKIRFSDPVYPANVDPNLQDLIQKLLCKNPDERLTAREALSHRYFFDYKNPGILGENFYIQYKWENYFTQIENNQQIQDFLKKANIPFHSTAQKVIDQEFDDETAILRILSSYVYDPDVKSFFERAKELSTNSKKRMIKTLTCTHAALLSPPNPKQIFGLGKNSHSSMQKTSGNPKGRRKMNINPKGRVSTFA